MFSIKTLFAASAVLLATLPAPQSAGSGRRDLIDHLFGAGSLGAVGGHGGLTCGIRKNGDLSVLSWPGPGLRDHMAHFASNAIDAHDQPLHGAHPGMGSFIGLILEGPGEPQVTWLRDESWLCSQSYAGPWAPVPVTSCHNDEAGLTVTLTDIVSPDIDVLTRRVQLSVDPTSEVTGARLILYANLAPSVSRIEQLPFADWALDVAGDFATVWDANAAAAVAFHPSDKRAFIDLVSVLGIHGDLDYGPIEAIMQSAAPSATDIAELVASIDQIYAPGIAAYVTTEPAPDGFQIGTDATPLCGQLDLLLDNLADLPEHFPTSRPPLDPQTADALRCADDIEELRAEHGWNWAPTDALADAGDGQLEGSPIAAGRTNIALITTMVASDIGYEASAVFALGDTQASAASALSQAGQLTAAERQSASIAAAERALAHARLPDPDLGQRVVDVARRALVNLYVARDRQTGAIVASVSRQPPYYLDWPRDGAFFTLALDVAGLADWAEQRLRWYVGLQRRSFTQGLPILTPDVPIDPTSGTARFPRYAWEMNYYTDGVMGGPIRFEIDNTALHIWSLAAHAAFLGDEARRDFAAFIWPSTKDALGMLMDWRDSDTGLPALANEDDHLELTSTLHGAVTVYAALEAGARLAAIVGDDDFGVRCADAAVDLRTAIMSHYYDEASQLFKPRRDSQPQANGGSTSWMAFPARLLEPDHPGLETTLLAEMDRADQHFARDPGGGSYEAKALLAAGMYGQPDGSRQRARDGLRALADIAEPGVDHFGEVFVPVGDDEWDHRVGAPHVWHGALFYLAAMSLSEPDLLDQDSHLPGPQPGGCGCQTQTPASGVPLLIVMCWMILRLRRRCPAPAPVARPGDFDRL